MHNEDSSITFSRCLSWRAKARSARQVSVAADTAKPSSSIRLCLFLIYYFTLCDTALKVFPLGVAIALRYLPEAILYVFAFVLLMKKWRIVSFPLFWPLCACALTMTISGILNSSSIFWVIGDFRSYFRFVAFTYIGWRTTVTPQRIVQFIKGFLILTIIELIVGGLELIGGNETRNLFAPVLGLASGASQVWFIGAQDAGGWICGTLQDYNQFGMFMTMSCVFALALYFMKGSGRHLWLASASALAVVLSFSRHSLLLLALALGCIFLLRGKRIAPASLMRGFIVVLVLVVALIGLGGGFIAAFEDRLASITSPETWNKDSVYDVRFYNMMILPPLFLKAYPFFGQGPITPSDANQFGMHEDTIWGPPIKAAPDLPGIARFTFGDVPWLMIMGLYGCCGLAAFGNVYWSIATACNRVRKGKSNHEGVELANVCLAAAAVIVVSGFFSLEMIARDTVPVFWFLAGMVFSSATNPLSKMQVVLHNAERF